MRGLFTDEGGPWHRHIPTIDEVLVSLMHRLDRSWFRTRRRAQMPDKDRIDAKERRIARGLRLAVYWYHQKRRG